MPSSASEIVDEIQKLYSDDSLPWIVGYSGGKDSSASLQLIWNAIVALPPEKRVKPIHVISTDTLVENPIIASWVKSSLESMRIHAKKQNVPIYPHQLVPSLSNRFWVNLIGRGYPAPRPKFRWCTDRLKISASTQFIREMSEANEEAILVLGQRQGESRQRDTVIDKYRQSTRERLSRNSNPQLSRVWVYLPIESWTSDDVWMYLMSESNPWGTDNRHLFEMYRGATPDAECPLVVDTSTPSCGDSRFGCYVCTMVAQDKSMHAMIQNDREKQWMQPMLDFRNNFLAIDDRSVRDFRRMNGSLLPFNGRLVHGPYLQEYRIKLLKELLLTQRSIQSAGKAQGFDIELISHEELEEIRRIWVEEKGEIEDWVPLIFEEVYDFSYSGYEREPIPFNREDLELLHQVSDEVDTDGQGELYRMTRNLLAIYCQTVSAGSKPKLSARLEKALLYHAFGNESDAEAFIFGDEGKVEGFDNHQDDLEPLS
ncbi:MAG: DNA phosphorothioation system sulfurtransferase DndC [Leptospirillum sp.]